MTASSKFPSYVIAPAGFNLRDPALKWGVLVQIAFCAAPAMALFGVGQQQVGARYFFAALLCVLGYHALKGDRLRFVTVAVGCVPVLMLLRSLFFYSSVMVILGGGLLLWWTRAPGEYRTLWRDKLLTGILLFLPLYWAASAFLSGSYSNNMRLMELAFSAAAIYLLAKHRSYLGTAMLGIGISTIAIGAGLLPYGNRLGMLEVGEVGLGNPIALGLPAALIFLLCLARKGEWQLLAARPLTRYLLMGGAGAFLALSTSRGSWLVAFVGLAVLAVFGRGQRAAIAASLIPLSVIGAFIILGTERGSSVKLYFTRAVSSENSLAQRTTGRYNQWADFPGILAASPVWGHGPGSGIRTNAAVRGEEKSWHSLYLHFGVELGMLGLAALLLALVFLIHRALLYWQRFQDPVPLLGVSCFMTVGLSVSGFDAISGVFLGLSFLSADMSNMFRARELRPRAAQGYPNGYSQAG
jgi:O-antigen ligase